MFPTEAQFVEGLLPENRPPVQRAVALLPGLILESKGMHMIFQKKSKERAKKCSKEQKRAKYLKI